LAQNDQTLLRERRIDLSVKEYQSLTNLCNSINPSSFITQIGCISITSGDIKILDPSSLLVLPITRKIVNSMMVLFKNREIVMSNINKNYGNLSSFMKINYNSHDKDMVAMNQQLLKSNKIFFPIATAVTSTVDSLYWSFIVAFSSSKSIVYFNPDERMLNDVSIETSLAQVKVVLETQAILEEKTIAWTVMKKSNITSQALPVLSNINNSGICMLKCMDYLLDDLPFDFDDASFKSYRNSIGLFLKNRNIPYDIMFENCN